MYPPTPTLQSGWQTSIPWCTADCPPPSLFVVTFAGFLTLNSTKQDRYFLPNYPFLNIMVAIGWVWAVDLIIKVVRGQTRIGSHRPMYLALFVVGLVVLNSLLVALSFPYYFVYYNPLFGGIGVAQKVVPVGWGEGLDLAAAYLNKKPEAEELTVALWYGTSSFAPFFVGETLDYYQQKGNVLASDM